MADGRAPPSWAGAGCRRRPRPEADVRHRGKCCPTSPRSRGRHPRRPHRPPGGRRRTRILKSGPSPQLVSVKVPAHRPRRGMSPRRRTRPREMGCVLDGLVQPLLQLVGKGSVYRLVRYLGVEGRHLDQNAVQRALAVLGVDSFELSDTSFDLHHREYDHSATTAGLHKRSGSAAPKTTAARPSLRSQRIRREARPHPVDALGDALDPARCHQLAWRNCA